MMSISRPVLGMLCMMAMAGPALGQGGVEATTQPAGAAAGVLYEDADAASSATITQVLPNSNTNLMTLGNVRRIRIVQEMVVIEWGGTATTLIPRQYVASINVNKRVAKAGGDAAGEK